MRYDLDALTDDLDRAKDRDIDQSKRRKADARANRREQREAFQQRQAGTLKDFVRSQFDGRNLDQAS